MFFIVLCISSSIGAQSFSNDNLIVKTRILLVDQKYAEAENLLTNELKNKPNNTELKVNIYTNFVMLYVLSDNFDKALYYSNLIKNIATTTQNPLTEAYANYCFARIYLLNNFPEKSVLFANKALEILKKYPNENYLKSELYRIISKSYITENEYSEKYKDYVLQEVEYIEKTNLYFDINVAYTDALLMYMAAYEKTKNQEDLDKIFYYAEKAIALVKSDGLSYYSGHAKASAYNNFASVINQFPYKDYSKEKRIEIGKSYLDQALAIAKKENFKNIEILCYTTYAELCQEKKCAKSYLEKAYEMTQQTKNNKHVDVELYLLKTLKNIYKAEGDHTKALKINEEELNLTKKSAANLERNSKKLIEVYYDLEQKRNQINQLKTKNKANNIQKFLFLGMLIFALIGLTFMFYTFSYRQKLNKQKTNILEKEIKESELILKLEKEEKARLQVEQDLLSVQQEQLQKQALAVSIQLDHKNTFIKDLKEKLKNNDFNIDRILRDERITENDFAEIKDVLQEVHPNFFKKLNSLSKSKLTNLDQKYAAYIYINMDNQKISNILKVDPKTVRVTKYRLKQKLGLDKSQDLRTFLENLI